MRRTIPIIFLAAVFFSGCILLPETTLTPTAAPVIEKTSTTAPVIQFTATHPGTATFTPTVTQTLIPTVTLTQTQTPVPTRTPTPTQTSTPVPYVLQEEAPATIENFAHPGAGCEWLGVAGQIFGVDGKPQLNLVVVVKGKLGADNLDLAGVSGIPEADIYGPGGYEIQLADEPSASTQSLSIQVYDLNGNALSDAYAFDTYPDCGRNLIVINFAAR